MRVFEKILHLILTLPTYILYKDILCQNVFFFLSLAIQQSLERPMLLQQNQLAPCRTQIFYWLGCLQSLLGRNQQNCLLASRQSHDLLHGAHPHFQMYALVDLHWTDVLNNGGLCSGLSTFSKTEHCLSMNTSCLCIPQLR